MQRLGGLYLVAAIWANSAGYYRRPTWPGNSVFSTLVLNAVMLIRCRSMSLTQSYIPRAMRTTLVGQCISALCIAATPPNAVVFPAVVAVMYACTLSIFCAMATWILGRTTQLLRTASTNYEQQKMTRVMRRARSEQIALAMAMVSSMAAFCANFLFLGLDALDKETNPGLTSVVTRWWLNITGMNEEATYALSCFVLLCNSSLNDLTCVIMCGLGLPKEKANQDFDKLCHVVTQQMLQAARTVHRNDMLQGDVIPWFDGFEFWFVSAGKILESEGPLPMHQDLLHRDGWLKKVRISLMTIVRREMCDDHAALSYCWGAPDHPDVAGTGADDVRAFLKDDPGIKWIWVDWCSLPQGQRTEDQKAEFKESLKNINMVYLAVRVIILLSSWYLTKFWPQFEAFLAFQIVNEKGLGTSDPASRRAHIVCSSEMSLEEQVATANELEQKWASADLTQAIRLLADPRVMVTNGKDKLTGISKLMELQDDLREAIASGSRTKFAEHLSSRSQKRQRTP